jgi:hypothetical protein
VTPDPFEVLAKIPPVELDDKLTVVLEATLATLPYASWTWTVIGPRLALEEAEPDTAPVRKTSWLATAGLFVKEKLAALVTPPTVAVTA